MKPNLLLSVALCSLGTASAAVEKPNVIFILADDLGYGDVSCLDERSQLNTVTIDQFASESVMYTDAHTSSSVSTPTRYGILTGRYNWRSSVKKGVVNGYTNKPVIIDGRLTMADMFRSSGYTTAFIGKWHLGWTWASKEGTGDGVRFNGEAGTDNIDYSKRVSGGPLDRGFDYSFGICASLDHPPYVYVENDYPTIAKSPTKVVDREEIGGFIRTGLVADDLEHSRTLLDITEKACKYIGEQADGDKPFFLYLPFTAPHTPLLPTEEFRGKSSIGTYGDFVLQTDAMLKMVLDAIDDAGIKENTLVVFTSDNGCSPIVQIPKLQELGHYPSAIYRGQKADLFDGGHRVPCFVRYPNKFKPHTVEQTVCLNDFYATFAAMVGYEIKDTEAEDSYNILSTLTSKKEPKAIREATVHHSMNGMFAIRKGDWKLLLTGSSGGWSAPKPGDPSLKDMPDVQLFNMKDDPAETTNLQAKYPEIVKEMKDLLIQYVEQGRSTPGAPQKNEDPYPWEQLDWM